MNKNVLAESDKTEVSSAGNQLQVEDEAELRLEREAEPKKCGEKCKKRRKKNRKNRKSRKNKGNNKKSGKSKSKKGRRSKRVKKQRSQGQAAEREACSFTAATVIAQVKTLIK